MIQRGSQIGRSAVSHNGPDPLQSGVRAVRAEARIAAERITQSAEQRKNETVKCLDDVAQSFHEAGRTLHDRQDDLVADYIEMAAENCHKASLYLRSHNVQQIKQDIGDQARTHPYLFLGAAVVAGFALGRFLRSTAGGGPSMGDADASKSANESSADIGDAWASTGRMPTMVGLGGIPSNSSKRGAEAERELHRSGASQSGEATLESPSFSRDRDMPEGGEEWRGIRTTDAATGSALDPAEPVQSKSGKNH